MVQENNEKHLLTYPIHLPHAKIPLIFASFFLKEFLLKTARVSSGLQDYQQQYTYNTKHWPTQN